MSEYKGKVKQVEFRSKIYVVEFSEFFNGNDYTYYEHYYTLTNARKAAKERANTGFKRVVINEYELGFIKQLKVKRDKDK